MTLEFKKHKRTTNAIRAVFYHPARMYKPADENVWCFVPRTKYRHIKLITLEHHTHLLDLERVPEDEFTSRTASLEQLALNAGQELKEKFRRKRKLAWWKKHVLYGRWFFEVTWRVHYADGSTVSQGAQGHPMDARSQGTRRCGFSFNPSASPRYCVFEVHGQRSSHLLVGLRNTHPSDRSLDGLQGLFDEIRQQATTPRKTSGDLWEREKEMKGSHHMIVYDEAGEKIGHLRITNDGEIYSAWICKQLLIPEKTM